jgi:hypothetical protein
MSGRGQDIASGGARLPVSAGAVTAGARGPARERVARGDRLRGAVGVGRVGVVAGVPRVWVGMRF